MKLTNLKVKDLLEIDQARIDRVSGLKIDKLRRYTVIDTKQKLINGHYVNVKIVSKVLKYRVASDSGNVYTVIVKLQPGFDFDRFKNNSIQVYCSCPDFMYRAAYFLNKSNNLYLTKTLEKKLNKALTIVPSISTTRLCKHLYIVLMDLRRNFKKYGLV